METVFSEQESDSTSVATTAVESKAEVTVENVFSDQELGLGESIGSGSDEELCEATDEDEESMSAFLVDDDVALNEISATQMEQHKLEALKNKEFFDSAQPLQAHAADWLNQHRCCWDCRVLGCDWHEFDGLVSFLFCFLHL